jgi:hypothetical protein
MNNTAVLRNIQNDILYRHIEGDIYKNLSTRVQAEIKPEIATKYLKLNTEATLMLNKNPHLEDLIFRLKLKIEVNATTPNNKHKVGQQYTNLH